MHILLRKVLICERLFNGPFSRFWDIGEDESKVEFFAVNNTPPFLENNIL